MMFLLLMFLLVFLLFHLSPLVMPCALSRCTVGVADHCRTRRSFASRPQCAGLCFGSSWQARVLQR